MSVFACNGGYCAFRSAHKLKFRALSVRSHLYMCKSLETDKPAFYSCLPEIQPCYRSLFYTSQLRPSFAVAFAKY